MTVVLTILIEMWPQSTKTQELIADARGGNANAINQLLDRHREAVRRMISLRMDRHLRQRVDASDIVQDVLIDASRRMSDYLKDPAMPFQRAIVQFLAGEDVSDVTVKLPPMRFVPIDEYDPDVTHWSVPRDR